MSSDPVYDSPLDAWMQAWAERGPLLGVWMLHGPEHSGKMRALSTLSSKYVCHSFSPNAAAEHPFAHNELMVQQAKHLCA